jgi:hypothetical protein
MSRDQITAIISDLPGPLTMLPDADPADKAETYTNWASVACASPTRRWRGPARGLFEPKPTSALADIGNSKVSERE